MQHYQDCENRHSSNCSAANAAALFPAAAAGAAAIVLPAVPGALCAASATPPVSGRPWGTWCACTRGRSAYGHVRHAGRRAGMYPGWHAGRQAGRAQPTFGPRRLWNPRAAPCQAAPPLGLHARRGRAQDSFAGRSSLYCAQSRNRNLSTSELSILLPLHTPLKSTSAVGARKMRAPWVLRTATTPRYAPRGTPSCMDYASPASIPLTTAVRSAVADMGCACSFQQGSVQCRRPFCCSPRCPGTSPATRAACAAAP